MPKRVKQVESSHPKLPLEPIREKDKRNIGRRKNEGNECGASKGAGQLIAQNINS